MSIIKLLSKKIDRILFTTPSHNQKPTFSKDLNDFYKYDLSEIEGFDNLSNPQSAILLAQGRVSELLNKTNIFYNSRFHNGTFSCNESNYKPRR